jgi:hypothetical protein
MSISFQTKSMPSCLGFYPIDEAESKSKDSSMNDKTIQESLIQLHTCCMVNYLDEEDIETINAKMLEFIKLFSDGYPKQGAELFKQYESSNISQLIQEWKKARTVKVITIRDKIQILDEQIIKGVSTAMPHLTIEARISRNNAFSEYIQNYLHLYDDFEIDLENILKEGPVDFNVCKTPVLGESLILHLCHNRTDDSNKKSIRALEFLFNHGAAINKEDGAFILDFFYYSNETWTKEFLQLMIKRELDINALHQFGKKLLVAIDLPIKDSAAEKLKMVQLIISMISCGITGDKEQSWIDTLASIKIKYTDKT